MYWESITSDPENVSAAVAANFMGASSTIAKHRDTHKEQVIKDYLKISDLVAQGIQKNNEDAAKDSANAERYEKLAQNWETARNNVNTFFLRSGAGSAEDLQAIYAPQVEENKSNIKFLKQVINVMGRVPNGRDQEAYMTAAEYAHMIEPTAGSAAGCANRYFKKGDPEKAVEFMEQAVELETDDTEKAKYCYTTAQILFTISQYTKARNYANQAIALNGSYGAPYILIAQMYANNNKWHDESALNKCTYFLAIDKLQRAKFVDPNVTEEANKLIRQLSAYTPKPEDLFFLGIKKGDKVDIGGWIGESTTVR